ncbi:MAG: TonB-dependent receptor [Myxococcales bacterium]|nr:TonB-dependent receptor [Myxococcales bacterium]
MWSGWLVLLGLAAPMGRVDGVVTERGTRRPVAGLVLRLADEETATDEAGHFQFEAVPPGVARLVVDDPDYTVPAVELRVLPGATTAVELRVERTSLAGTGVRVVGRRARVEVVERHLDADTIRTQPGTGGDPLKVVQSMPGAARVAFDGGDLILRGGGNTQAFIEGHPILSAFHFGGWRSVISASLIDDLAIVPGNQATRYGRGVGGVVDVKLRRPAEDGLHGYAEADFFDAGAFVEGPLGPGSFALGARRSYVDGLLPLLDDAPAFTTAPRYYDAEGLYDVRLGAHRLRLFSVFSSDAIAQVLEEPDENDASLRDGYAIETYFVSTQIAWDAAFSDAVRHHLSLAVLDARDQVAVGAGFDLDLDYQLITAREELTVDVVDADAWGLRLRGGLDLEVGIGAYRVTAPAIPGAGGLATPLGVAEPHFAEDDGACFGHPAAWVEAELRLGDLTLTPGLRVDHDTLVDDTAVQPRLQARYALTRATALSAGVGLFAENVDFAAGLPDFGNPDLDMQRSAQASLGVSHQVTAALKADLTGYYKRITGLIVTDPAEQLANRGEGRAYGLEVLLKHDRDGHFHGWLAYTLSRSEQRVAPDAPFAPFDHDQTHNLTLVAGWRFDHRWELGARWRYVTGDPYTAIDRATFDADADAFVPGAGRYNGARLGAFHQLDLRVDRHWIFDDWRLTTYLEARNAYNRANPEGVEYAYDYRHQQTVSGLPILPSFGLRGTF